MFPVLFSDEGLRNHWAARSLEKFSQSSGLQLCSMEKEFNTCHWGAVGVGKETARTSFVPRHCAGLLQKYDAEG